MTYVGGQYVGLGEGDVSDEVAKITDFIRRKWDRFDYVLAAGNRLFTTDLKRVVTELQGIYKANGTLKEPFIPGVVNLATKYALGYLRKDVILPLYFSVEGHLSDMWVGPVAYVGEVLRAEGRALHFPTDYDRAALPFKNPTGVAELTRRFGQTVQDNGVKFPAGTPCAVGAFSQGAMIWYDFYHQQLAPGKPLNWRLKDIKAAVVCGDPNREKGVCAPFIPDPPPKDHQGIMDVRWENTPEWMIELARAGDMYTDNTDDERGRNKTAIAKIITQNQWSGGPAGLLSRVMDLVTPMDDIIPVTMALFDAIKFVGGGLKQHGGYNMEPAVQFARERLAA